MSETERAWEELCRAIVEVAEAGRRRDRAREQYQVVRDRERSA